ncbi:hypothetical protein LTS16_024371 [Friedmanniomyces endolithicus]|nr:hypothetical protein LTR57_023058 [Friedmanniomyces endolithicus]KAK1024060.1 hypothetical protein LTS16_024371 [Friedmanniomyces endolithicus]
MAHEDRYRPLATKLPIRHGLLRVHDQPLSVASTCAATARTELESEDDGFVRAINGVLVQFEDGGRVSKVSLLGEASSIRLEDLPPTSTPISVCTLLRGLGQNAHPDAVEINSTPRSSSAVAYISFEESEIASGASMELTKQFAAQLEYHNVVSRTVIPKLPAGAAVRRISCSKVLVSWYRPTRLVWLNFGAQRVAGWAEIERSLIGKASRPQHIELGKGAAAFDTESAPTLVESLLTQIGSVDLKLDPRNHEKRFKAVALFANESDAREAVETLHDRPQDFLGQSKTFTQLLSSAKFKISSKIYDCNKEQLDDFAVEWRTENVVLRVYPDLAKRLVTLKIEGEKAKAIANAASVIDHIIAGKIIEVEHAPFWTPALVTNGPAYQILQRVQLGLGVLIVRNKAKKELHFFGAPGLYPQAQQMLLEQIGAQASLTRSIGLNQKQFAWRVKEASFR